MDRAHSDLKTTINKIDVFLSSYDKHRQRKLEEFFNTIHEMVERLKEAKLEGLEEVRLRKVKEELYKKEREVINYEELLEEKRVVQLIKLNEEILESGETIRESDILSAKLIRHLRNLTLTYTYNEESLLGRLKRVVDDQLVYISVEEGKKQKFFEKYTERMGSGEGLRMDRGIQSEEEYEY